ncbi:MAG: ABC transporter substrate-binding protein [Acidimicrobiia bacterium]
MKTSTKWRMGRGGEPILGSRSLRLVALTAALMLVISACGSGDAEPTGDSDDATTTTEAAAEQSTTLRINHPQEPPNWDYVQGTATAIRALLVHNVVEPLIEEMQDGTYEPLLAEEFEISDDGLAYTFHIREATFHDGSELDAADVVYSLEYNRTSPHGQVSVPYEAVESIEATDDRTVVVTLSRPSQRFLDGMSNHSGLIIPEGGVETLEQSPIGTGPFTFDEWRPGVEVQLGRYDEYWGDAPYFENVEYRFVSDETASINALLAGDVDVIASILGEGIDRYASVDETDGFTGMTTAGTEITYLSMNASDPLFDDERIRQAIAHAIDREPILQAAFAGLAQPTCVFVNPPNVPWDSDYCPYPYDPDRSRELLAEAGAEGLEIDFKFLTIAEFPPIMEVVTAQLTEVGINVTTDGRELATYLDEVINQTDYQFTSLSGPAQIDAWVCPGRFTLDCVPEFDELLAEADASVDPEVWANLRREAVELHADRAYLIPVGNKDEVSLLRDDLAGVKPYRSNSEFDFRDLRWEG